MFQCCHQCIIPNFRSLTGVKCERINYAVQHYNIESYVLISVIITQKTSKEMSKTNRRVHMSLRESE